MRLLLSLLAVSLLLLPLASATRIDCDAIPQGTCSGVTLVELSDSYNAHSAVPGSGYPWELCCSGTGVNSNTGPGQPVISLYQKDNSHAQAPGQGAFNYSYTLSLFLNDPLSKSFHCYFDEDGCLPGDDCVITLSAETNAHLAGCSSSGRYAPAICCANIYCDNNNDCGSPSMDIYCDGKKSCVRTSTPQCEFPGRGNSFCEDELETRCSDCSYSCADGECVTPECSSQDAPRPCGVCKEGLRYCSGGSWGSCVGDRIPVEEECNNIDDDCDGSVDEGDVCLDRCGDGVCSSDYLDTCPGVSYYPTVYGSTFTLKPARITKSSAELNVDGKTGTLNIGETKNIGGLDIYLSEISGNSILLKAAVGENPAFKTDPDGSPLIEGGADLSPGRYIGFGPNDLSDDQRTLDESDLPAALASGIVEDDNGAEYQYSQSVKIRDVTVYYHDDYEKRRLVWQMGTSTLNPFYLYRISFRDVINFSDPDVHGNEIMLSGKAYQILPSPDPYSLELYGGGKRMSFDEGQAKTIDIDGTTYEIVLIGVADQDTAVVKVDDQSRSIDRGQSRNIAGLDVHVNGIILRTKEGQVSSASLELGASRISLRDGYEVMTDSQNIKNTLVDFWQSSAGTSLITIEVSAQRYDQYLTPSSPYTDPVFGAIAFALGDYNSTYSEYNMTCGDNSLGARIVVGESKLTCDDCSDVACYQSADCGGTQLSQYCSGESQCSSETRNICWHPGTYYAFCAPQSSETCSACQYGCQDGRCVEGECGNGNTLTCGPKNQTGTCRQGTRTCSGNSWDVPCEGAVYPANETCYNNLDDDCNGIVDDMCLRFIYPSYTSETMVMKGDRHILSLWFSYSDGYKLSSDIEGFFDGAGISFRLTDPDGVVSEHAGSITNCEEVKDVYYPYASCEIIADLGTISKVGFYNISVVENDYVISEYRYNTTFPKFIIYDRTILSVDPEVVDERIITEDIGDYTYTGFDILYQYYGGAMFYIASYADNDADSPHDFSVGVLENSDSESASSIIKDFLISSSYEISDLEINGMTVYEFSYDDIPYAYVWRHDNYIVIIQLISYPYTSDAFPEDLIVAYLERYSSDLSSVCGNGLCEGKETLGTCPEDCGECQPGQIKACGTSDIGICSYGRKECANYTWTDCLNETRPVPEVCANSLDDNCNGQADEECTEENKVNANLWIDRILVTQGDSLIVSVIASDSFGNRLQGANVTVSVYPSGKTQTGVTDENGMWTHLLRFGTIGTGTYTIEAQAAYPGLTAGIDTREFEITNNPVPVSLSDDVIFVNMAQIIIRTETIRLSLVELDKVLKSISNYYDLKGNSTARDAWSGISSDTESIIDELVSIKGMITDFIDDPSDSSLNEIKKRLKEASSSVKEVIKRIAESA